MRLEILNWSQGEGKEGVTCWGDFRYTGLEEMLYPLTMKYQILLYSLFLFSAYPVMSQQNPERPKVHIGGALRFNYNYSDWNKGHRGRGGDFGYDVFMLHPSASYKGFLLEADARFYSTAFGGFMLKYGWIGYQFSEKDHLEVGLTKVPFGIQPASANNFFFQISYYVGLEDDSDMGIKYVHSDDKWEYAAAFFKNADELLFGAKNETSDDRYGYDVAGRNKEINQWNAQVIYKFGNNFKQKFGVSGLFGQLYNLDTRRSGTHFAFAVHYVVDWKNWNLKAEVATYAKHPRNAAGEVRDLVSMTAYGAPYLVAAKANIYTLSFSHNFPIKSKWLQNILMYHDTGILQKWNKNFKNSSQNVTGMMMTMGPVATYVDYAMGKHHAWLGPDWNAFGTGTENSSWHSRFNINIGYYF